HPGQLNARFAGTEQAAGIEPDAVASAFDVPGDDVGEHGIEFVANEVKIAGVRQIGAHGFEEPEGGIHGVVLGNFAVVGKAVGQHAAIHVLRETAEYVAGDVEATGR